VVVGATKREFNPFTTAVTNFRSINIINKLANNYLGQDNSYSGFIAD